MAKRMIRMVDGGIHSLAGNPIPANGGINVDITFSNTFRTIPVITLTPFFTTNSNANLANISIGVVQRSATGFKARILNPTASELTLGSFYWIAVEIT